ncbi:TetR/AcrR family transcriptional regulator [Streptomyces griseocarneus]|uniref:TetR/AcrR family transcriptional regulator n=1 Tax=Streptomyces griseocarneus TaxID=51201 RepID=UPI00167DE0E6|nr:TetR family transcriptional regulator C-terminal domain-containing protein [Streptomyces griseocarneus]MBZ6473662.1 TetR family transcriptional regulator C-terminal domain-containing protein [Streptomyces griseocarneus]GHG64395.1 TetR family transcriptional regulator [Streptomyces griseocarneus]
MPKLVDPAARRLEVVDAVFRVVVRDGLAQASLRNVADEAGLNIGSVRHYFAGHQELMLFAMRSMLDRVSHRLARHIEEAPDLATASGAERRAVMDGLLCELLPLDDVRRAEVTVFVEFMTAARTDSALGDLAREAAEGSRGLITRILYRLSARGDLRPGLDPDTEAVRLWGLIDGLCLNSVLHPDLLSPDACVTALRGHLAQITTDSDADGHSTRGR